MDKKKITANTKKVAAISTRINQKMLERIEKILGDAEELVKKEFPAKFVSASLTRLQNKLYKEGIECEFDPTVTRQAIRKTANSDITKDECDEAIDKIAEAVVEETEESIGQCEAAIDEIAKNGFEDGCEVIARRIKKRVASRMSREGLNFEF